MAALQQSEPLFMKIHNYKANQQKFQCLFALQPVFGPVPDTEYKYQIGIQLDYNSADPELPRKILEMGRVLRLLPQAVGGEKLPGVDHLLAELEATYGVPKHQPTMAGGGMNGFGNQPQQNHAMGGFGQSQPVAAPMMGGYGAQPVQQQPMGIYGAQPVQQSMGGYGAQPVQQSMGGYGAQPVQQQQQPMGGYGSQPMQQQPMGGYGSPPIEQHQQQSMGGFGAQPMQQQQQPMGGYGAPTGMGGSGGYNNYNPAPPQQSQPSFSSPRNGFNVSL